MIGVLVVSNRTSKQWRSKDLLLELVSMLLEPFVSSQGIGIEGPQGRQLLALPRSESFELMF
jgi:signal transduction protein with GAF and PtsI domain